MPPAHFVATVIGNVVNAICMSTSVLWIVRFQNILRNTLLPYFNKIEECHPSDLQLRWLQTRKPLAYRESTRIILSVTYHYENMVYSVLKHIDTTRMHTIGCRPITRIYWPLGERILYHIQPFL